MAFWGVEVKPSRAFTLRSEDVSGRLIVSQATLGVGSSTKKSILQCKVGDRHPIFLCTLLPDKVECCPLNLEFEEDDNVKFSVIGPTSVHLSGFIQGQCGGEEDDQDDYETDLYGDEIRETDAESSDYDSEDDFMVDYTDEDDIDTFSPSPVRNSGVVIEEIVDDEKPATENGKNEQPKSATGKKLQRQIVPKGRKLSMASEGKSTPVSILESEDEDGFPVSTSTRSEDNIKKPEAKKAKNESKKSKEGKNKNNEGDKSEDAGAASIKGLKRKASAFSHDEGPKGESMQEASHAIEVVAEGNINQKKKKKNQDEDAKDKETVGDKMEGIVEDKPLLEEASSAATSQPEHDSKSATDDNIHAANGRLTDEMKAKKKKKKKKAKKDAEGVKEDEEIAHATSDEKVATVGEEDTKSKASHVRTFANGLAIEELEMGKPDGKRASRGKKVSVHYIGKLMKNNKIFDSNIGRAPFQFRLGIGSVIKGWDVGVEGMRIGDKRRLTIPPSMGYKSQGAPPKIPPNAWLVFDVELVNVS